MKRLGLTIAVVALMAVGTMLFRNRDRIHTPDDAWNLIVEPLAASAEVLGGGEGEGRRGYDQARIRIATFDLGAFGADRLDDPAVAAAIGRIVREFQVVSLQGVDARDPGVVAELMEWINLDEDRYNQVTGPSVGPTDSPRRYVIVFDRTAIEVDRTTSYLVADPDDLLRYEPFVVPCRVKGPDPQRAFTFTLVSVAIDPADAARELSWMDDVFRAVRGDGRGEDDVVMLGNLQAPPAEFDELGSLFGLTAAIQGRATDTRQTRASENLLFCRPATVEFTGRSDVFDFYTALDLTMDEAVRISEHLPVWAEFQSVEGDQDVSVAWTGESASAR